MDSRQMEQKFDAIYMVILHGQLTAARSAFKISIQIEIDEKLDQIIDFLEKEDMSCSIKDIEKFRSEQLTKCC
ncbi:MAG: hypothetical protein IH823_01335 [Candidatus Dadabacteria bacterium]|nr:hypothetical protein [Candidatus Dadabacteria bacterium]